MTRCFIGLGSNLGEPRQQLAKALSALSTLASGGALRVSPLYRSLAIGPGKQPDYLNAVAELECALPALTLLRELQAIETAQGRERLERWGARTLDLDLLLYGDDHIDTPELTVPHPRLRERQFVVQPLLDLAPQLTLPNGELLSSYRLHCAQEELQRLDMTLEQGGTP